MFLNFIYIFILIHGSCVNSHDIELEGMLRIGDSFLNQLKNNIHFYMRSKNDKSSLVKNDMSSKSREKNESSTNIEPHHIDKIELNDKAVANMRNHNFNISNGSDINTNVNTNKMDGIRDPIKSIAKKTVGSDDANKFKTHLFSDNSKQDKHFIDEKDFNKEKSKKHEYPKMFNKYDIRHFNPFGLVNNNNNVDEKYKVEKKDISHKQQDSVHVNWASNSEDIYLKDDDLNEFPNEFFKIRSKEHQNYYTTLKSFLSKDHPRANIFLEFIIYNDVENIEKIAERLQQKIALERPVFLSLVNTTCASYSTKIKRYIAFMKSQEPNTDIDREFLYLDIVESSNMLLYSEERKLFNTMVNIKQKNLTEYDLKTLTENLYKENIQQKKRQMFLLCEELKICRAYPGFSDYFAELTSEILKLSDSHLETVVKIITNLIKKRAHFFKSFMKGNVADMIGEELEAVSKDLYRLREMFSVIRSIIIQRFKRTKTTDYVLRNKTKAVRILLDIIDKSFSLATGKLLTVITFDSVVKAIRYWALGKRDEIDIPLKLLLEHIVGVFRYNWDQNIRSEVAMLTEVMVTGKTDLTDIHKELFSRGSQFVRFDIVNSG